MLPRLQWVLYPGAKLQPSAPPSFDMTCLQYVRCGPNTSARQSLPASFPLQHHHQSHYPQHNLLQPRVLTQQDRDVAHKGNEADHAANDVLFTVEEGLALCV